MPYKLDDKGQNVCVNGLPIFIKPDGEEIGLDGDQAFGKIQELNAENAARRTALKAAEDKLAALPPEVLADPAAAVAALVAVKDFNKKDWVSVGEVERIRKEAQEGLQTQLRDVTTGYETKLKKRDQEVYDLSIGGQYKDSAYVKEKLVLPPPIAHQTFSNQLVRDAEGRIVGGYGFERQDSGRIVGYLNGQPILSKAKLLGEPAEFDEALAVMVDNYPLREQILRGTPATGTGNPPAALGGGGNTYTLSRTDARDPARYEAVKEAAAKAGQQVQFAPT